MYGAITLYDAPFQKLPLTLSYDSLQPTTITQPFSRIPAVSFVVLQPRCLLADSPV
jgi:hypothetical protein